MTVIHADELRLGDDVVDDNGQHHFVTLIDARTGWSFPIAFCADGWAFAVGHQLVRVERGR